MAKYATIVIFLGAAVGFAAGCTPFVPGEAGYGAPQQAVYGTQRRVGLATACSARTEYDPHPLADALGFDPSPTVDRSAEVYYALPLGPGSDLKIAVGSRSWLMLYDGGGPVYLVDWGQIGIVLLLRGGWTWGRFGAHIGAGPGWVFNDVDGLPDSRANTGDYALEVECGVSMAIRGNLTLGFDLGYRANTTELSWEGNTDKMDFSAAIAKIGIAYMF